MDWIVHTPALRHLHMGLAVTSGVVFATRGAATLRGHRWPRRTWVRQLAVVIDTGLLAAALRLLWMLHLNPLSLHWLQAKFVALVLYIGLGTLALKTLRRPGPRAWAYALALGCYGYIVTVAISHSSWGPVALVRHLH